MSRNNKSIKWKGLNITLNYLGKFRNNDFGIKTKHIKLYDIENLNTPLNMNKQTNNFKFSPIKISDYNILSDRNFFKYLNYYKYFDRINTSNRINTDFKKRLLGRNNEDNFNIMKYRTLRYLTQDKQSTERTKTKNFNFSVEKTHSKKKLKLKINIGKRINDKSNFYYMSQNYSKIIHVNKNKIKKLLFDKEVAKPKIMK